MDVLIYPGIRKYAQKSNVLDKINPRITLIILAFLGLGLRLFFLRYRFTVSFDEVNYLKLGVSGHLNGLADVLHTYWSPMLPTLIAFFCDLTPNYELAGRLVSVAAGVLVIFPVYSIACRVFNQKAGIFAAGFIAIFPPLAFQSTAILTEPLTMFFGAYCIFFGLKMLESYSVANALLAGIFTGFAYLTHPMAFGFFIMLLGWMLLGSFSKLYLIRKVRLFYLLPALIISFVVCAAPYLFFLKQETGTWTLSAKGAANQQMESPMQGQGSSFRDLDESNTRVPIDMVFHQGTFLQATEGGNQPVRAVNPIPFLKKFAKNFSNVLQKAVPQVLTTIPMLLLGVGLFGAMWSVQKSKAILYLLSFLFFFWLFLIPAFHIHLRYVSPMWPICAVFIANGVVHIHAWLSSYMPLTKAVWRKRMQPSTFAAVAIITVFFVLSFLPEFGRVISRNPNSTEYVADPIEHKAAGFWLNENTDAPVIMSRNHAVDFYAGNYNIKQSVTIPTNSLDRVLDYARYRYVTHIVLDERYKSDYPELEFLLLEENIPDELELVYKKVNDAGLTTIIYKIL